jgi:hypothetical protein
MSLLIATQNMGFSPVDLFMDADLVVKSVIIGLALSSVWVCHQLHRKNVRY